MATPSARIRIALNSPSSSSPSTFLLPTEDPLRYFLIAGLFNAIRIPALGVAMGYLYRKFVTTDRRERLQNGTYASPSSR